MSDAPKQLPFFTSKCQYQPPSLPVLCLACVIFKLKRPSGVRSSDVRQKVPFIDICILILGHPPLILFSLGLGLYHMYYVMSTPNNREDRSIMVPCAFCMDRATHLHLQSRPTFLALKNTVQYNSTGVDQHFRFID